MDANTSSGLMIPDLSDVPELSIVAEGEYALRVISARQTISNNTGRQGLQIICKIFEIPNTENVFHTFWFPTEEEKINDPEKYQNMWRMFKTDLSKLGAPTDRAYDASELQGLEFKAYVIIEAYEGRESNKIKRIIG